MAKKITQLQTVQKQKKRSFDAAKQHRLLASWAAVSRSINVDLKEGVDQVRGRARDLAQNDTAVKKYLSLNAANIVGSTGFVLQAKVMNGDKEDKFANTAIESAWANWCKAGVCDISGRMTKNDFDRALIKSIARDGEALIYEHIGADNEYGYALQLLDVNRLVTRLNEPGGNGKNAIIMGVEIDGNGRPIKYHLYDYMVGDDQTKWTYKAYSADRVIHLFITDSPEQVRGYSWLHASMTRLYHLKKYQEWAIIAAAVGASKMGFFTTPEGDGTEAADGEDETGALYQEAAGGQFGVLPEGWDFKSFSPDYPHTMYDSFVKAAKRDISSGLDVSYHALSNDLEGVNFSSIRSGTLEEREEWKVKQDWFIGAYQERIYNNWLKYALLKGAIKLSNGSALPASKYDKFKSHTFLGRRWSWVDPLKDVQANVLAMENALLDPYTIAAQQGMDAEEIIEAIARFKQAMSEKGIEPKDQEKQGQDTFNDGEE